MLRKTAALICCVLFLSALMTVISNAAEDMPCPEVSARGAVLMEADSKSIVFEKDAHVRLPMASTTKIMTALVAIENGQLDKTVKIPDTAVGVEGSSVYLKAGEELTLEELLYAVLLESANDAATAVAIEVGGSVENFARMMNEKARSLGLSDTHFTNPHGLDNEEHYTTASDLAVIAASALENDTFAKIVSTYKTTIPGSDYDRVLVNHNRLLKTYSGSVGVKTGYTKRSGRCLVSAAERDGVRLVAVTLSDPGDWKDHTAMLDYGFSLLKCAKICDSDGLVYDIPVSGGSTETVRAATNGKFSVTVPKDSRVTATVEARRFLWAPVRQGDYVGKVQICVDGRAVTSLELFACESCEERGSVSIFDKIFGKN